MLRKDNASSETRYVGTPTVAGSYKVQASAAGIATVTSGVVTVSPPELRFSRNPVTVGKGLKTYVNEVAVQRSVGGTAFAGTEAITVNLICSSTSICTVPSSVTIPAGQSQVYIYVTGVDTGTTTIVASAVGYTSAQDLAVSVVTPQLVFSGLANTSVGATDTFSVYVNVSGSAYPSSQTAVSPIIVNLTSSAPGVATVPTAVTIPMGSTFSGNALLTGVAAGTTTVTASGSGLSSVTSGAITVSP
jgi:hypothetical protein